MNYFCLMFLAQCLVFCFPLQSMDLSSTSKSSSSSASGDAQKKVMEEALGDEILDLIKEMQAEDLTQRSRVKLGEMLTKSIYRRFSESSKEVQRSDASNADLIRFNKEMKAFVEKLSQLKVDYMMLRNEQENAKNQRYAHAAAVCHENRQNKVVDGVIIYGSGYGIYIDDQEYSLFGELDKWVSTLIIDNILFPETGCVGRPIAHWGEVFNLTKVQNGTTIYWAPIESSYGSYANVEAIAGSWVKFLNEAIEEINRAVVKYDVTMANAEQNNSMDLTSRPHHGYVKFIIPDVELVNLIKQRSQCLIKMFQFLKEYALKRSFSAEYKDSWSGIVNLYTNLSEKYSPKGLNQETERRQRIADEKAKAQQLEEEKAMALERERQIARRKKQIRQEGLEEQYALERQLADLKSRNAALGNN